MTKRSATFVTSTVSVTEDNDISSIGGSLTDFLKEEGLYDDVNAEAIKRVYVWQLAKAMQDTLSTRVAVAKKMNTSRPQVDRVLDPKNVSTSLKTLADAAASVGKRLKIDLVDA